jgi:sugar lactone lactonase YvrE
MRRVRRLFWIAACLLLCSAVQAQSIFTIAGGGTDDGRPATVARLYRPFGVALDAAGNLYIADTYNNRIRKVAAGTGLITTVAGIGSGGFSGDGGPATAAELAGPRGVVLDSGGNLYIADSGRIRKVTAGSGIISTLAGNGSGRFGGDGGAATLAGLAFTQGVVLDSAGNLYIADTLDHRIRKIAAGSGIITTVAGNGSEGFSGDGGAATAAKLAYPLGVTLDSAGNLYIADGNNFRIRKVGAGSGIITTVAGNGSGTFSGDGGAGTLAGLAVPQGVAVDAEGNLYIAGDARIRKVAAGSGIITTVAGNGSQGFSGDGGAATAAEFISPYGIALDSAENLYIADIFTNRIRRIAAGNGLITTVAGTGPVGYYSGGLSGDGDAATAAGLSTPYGLALDSAGNLYIADIGNYRIRKVAAGSGIITTIAGIGSQGFSGDGGAATAAPLSVPHGVALDLAGDLYLTDTNRVRKVTAGSGIITTVAGNGGPDGFGGFTDTGGFSGDGGAATAAGLNYPRGVAMDSAGNLFIADTQNHRIRKVAAGSGIITTVAGSGPIGFGSGGLGGDGGAATAAGLNQPHGVALDSVGNLYIADSGNNRIRKVTAGSGIITTVAGGGSGGDGSAATGAGLSFPSGVAVDPIGNLYIADFLNHRIRKVGAGSGIITTVAGNGSQGFSGDSGAATAAGLNYPFGIALDSAGTLYIADSNSSRVRIVLACVTVPAPNLQQPSNASISVPSSPRLAWSPARGAFHYDVYLDTANPPQTVVAADITASTYSPANLEPLTQYYWKVVAKGDPFCTPFSSASSDVFSFTTTGTCGAPGPLSGTVSTSSAESAGAGAPALGRRVTPQRRVSSSLRR